MKQILLTIEVFIQTFWSWALGYWMKNNWFFETKLKVSKVYICVIAASNERSFGRSRLCKSLGLIQQKDRVSMTYQLTNNTI